MRLQISNVKAANSDEKASSDILMGVVSKSSPKAGPWTPIVLSSIATQPILFEITGQSLYGTSTNGSAQPLVSPPFDVCKHTKHLTARIFNRLQKLISFQP